MEIESEKTQKPKQKKKKKFADLCSQESQSSHMSFHLFDAEILDG